MTSPERIYALLVEANPIPDPDDVSPPQPTATRPLRLVPDTDSEVDRPGRVVRIRERPGRRVWVPALVTAAVLAAAVAGALWIAGATEQRPVVTEPPNTTTPVTLPDLGPRGEAAKARVEAFYAALDAGDLGEVEALAAPDGTMEEADRLMWAYNAIIARRYPQEVVNCAVIDLDNSLFVEVECAFAATDPVFVAVGVSELIAPWQVFDDAGMTWFPFRGAEFEAALRAYADYLIAVAPDAYMNLCEPPFIGGADINHVGGISLTPDCAELILSVAEETAAWVETGRPALGGSP